MTCSYDLIQGTRTVDGEVHYLNNFALDIFRCEAYEGKEPWADVEALVPAYAAWREHLNEHPEDGPRWFLVEVNER